MTLDAILATRAPPLIAILRGLTPVDAPAVGAALIAAGSTETDALTAAIVATSEPSRMGAGNALNATATEETVVFSAVTWPENESSRLLKDALTALIAEGRTATEALRVAI